MAENNLREMDYTKFGHRVRQRRKELKYTQEQLAKMCRLSLSFLGHIERGTRKASIDTLILLANALKVDANYLLSDSLYHEESAGKRLPLDDFSVVINFGQSFHDRTLVLRPEFERMTLTPVSDETVAEKKAEESNE